MLAESISWNRFLGSLKFKSTVSGIDPILAFWVHKRLQIRAQRFASGTVCNQGFRAFQIHVASNVLSWKLARAGISKESMRDRNRGGIGLSYRPARLHRLAELMPWNRFRGSINVEKYGLRSLVSLKYKKERRCTWIKPNGQDFMHYCSEIFQLKTVTDLEAKYLRFYSNPYSQQCWKDRVSE